MGPKSEMLFNLSIQGTWGGVDSSPSKVACCRVLLMSGTNFLWQLDSRIGALTGYIGAPVNGLQHGMNKRYQEIIVIATKLNLTSLLMFTRAMEKVALKMVEILASAVGSENPIPPDLFFDMRNRLRDLLKTPQGDWYKGKLTRHGHFDALAHIDDALNRVPTEFTDEDRCRFMASCFGHFLMMHQELKFSGGVIHRLLLRELHYNGPTDVMQFMLGNQSVRFPKVYFFLIIELRFGVVPDTTKYAAVENGIHQRYFPRANEVSLEEIRGVVTDTEFGEAYDAVKLYLIYMLNWILIGVDERFKIPVWQFRLVEDLDEFQWGVHVYIDSIYSFKHAFDGRRDGFEQLQQEMGTDVHTVETYNIYGISNALLIFAFEMFARKELVPTPAEGQAPYYAGLNEGGAYRPQRERHRRIRVLFTTPRHGTSSGDSRGGIGRDRETPWADLLNDVHEALRKSKEERERQHLKLVDMIQKSDDDRQQQHRVLLDMI
ncbi:hypothetical protein Ddye_030328 [Dipteronia dyeriana]|uniref:Uncharacterized protein n=1 Tax=Dipteronia dyeriana TaxID=168575 RepID=A0AAD9WLH5_9ROSI|nr:hypothetical protein Ddye_030328 [Dipteronia dyeriana]